MITLRTCTCTASQGKEEDDGYDTVLKAQQSQQCTEKADKYKFGAY